MEWNGHSRDFLTFTPAELWQQRAQESVTSFGLEGQILHKEHNEKISILENLDRRFDSALDYTVALLKHFNAGTAAEVNVATVHASWLSSKSKVV